MLDLGTPLHRAPAVIGNAVPAAVHAGSAEAGRLLFGSFRVDFPLDVAVVESWADAE